MTTSLRPAFIVLVATIAALAGDNARAAAQASSRQPAASLRAPGTVTIEFENLVAAARPSAGQVGPQDMQGFGPGWSAGQLLWRPPAPTNSPIRNWPNLSVPFDIPADGTYELSLRHTAGPDFGMFRVFVDGEQLGDVDGYSSNVAPRVKALGQRTLRTGKHQLIVTVVGKATPSTGFLVGLDRLDMRPVNATAVGAVRQPAADVGGPQQPGAVAGHPPGNIVARVRPELITRAICLNSPETCCPPPSANSPGCAMVAQSMLDIRIRSYVPPRFTELGKNDPWDTSWALENVVSDVNRSGPPKVWAGCRFNVTQVTNAIEDNKTLLEKAGELLEAWLSQWSSGIDSAKSFVSQGVADGFCDIVDDSQSCRDTVAPLVKTGINIGIASLGIPPDLPDIQQLRQNAIHYLAAEAASRILGDPSILNKLPLDEKTRRQLFDMAYGKSVDILSKELNKIVPSPNFTSENPATWGHLEPAYAPHNAHLYIEVHVKPEAYDRYVHFITGNPKHRWMKLTLFDLNHVYGDKFGIDVPTFIPPEGVILPIELLPSFQADSEKDDAFAQIPDVMISRKWLEEKFGISAVDGFVKAGVNWQNTKSQTSYTSDWDLFYYSSKQAKFQLFSFVTDGSLRWESDWTAGVGTVRDADTGVGVRDKQQLKNYYGRIDPAPRCDGQPNEAVVK